MTKEERWLLEEKYHGVSSLDYQADLERLGRGEPIGYVIGFTDFLGAKIDLSYRPLIPRAETEYWVEKAIADMRKKSVQGKLRVLDIFSGSGCIGIAVLTHLPDAVVDFADIAPNALNQIQKNTTDNAVAPDRYAIYTSDVYAGIPQGNQYDVILANPPYISQDNIGRVDQSVLDHEPHQALFSIEDGFELIRKTIDGAIQFLSEDGILFLECDDIQYKAVSDMLTTRGFTYEFFKDQFGLWRFVRAVK